MTLYFSGTAQKDKQIIVAPYMSRTACRGSNSDSDVGGCMERLDLSYGEVVSTRGLRVQALLGGSNSPTSQCPEAVD